MATLTELVSERAHLNRDQLDHLLRLTGSWQLIADLCFADLLLWCKSENGGLVCVSQMRPYTAKTLHPDDEVGRQAGMGQMQWVEAVFSTGRRTRQDRAVILDGASVSVEAVPVKYRGQVPAVMTLESAPLTRRRPGRLEQNYLECGSVLVQMVADGAFPFAGEGRDPENTPRVGDGMLRIDAGGRVVYASPNAVSAFRRLGFNSNVEGELLSELALDTSPASLALRLGTPAEGEAESEGTVVLQHAIPLLQGPARKVIGVVLLLRDVTELRLHQRQLQRKETVISEVHHRVKNNLQTIASLLRLQARRLPKEAAGELDEAVRRIASIALVHETLSMQAGQSVEFGEVAHRLVNMVSEGLIHPEHNIQIYLEGDPGRLVAEDATALAIAMVELVQNAVEHAFGPEGGRVEITMNREGDHLQMTVADNGKGLAGGGAEGLGLQIVRTLAESELRGSLKMESNGGTRVCLEMTAQARGPGL
ncbi:MAG: sensor histidine kinase [Actinomycetota bacterium]